MAELAFGITGLIATAEVVFSRMYKYIKHVKEAERDILELMEQVNILYGTLQRLSLLRRETSHDVTISGVKAHDTAFCAKALDRLRDKLGEFNSDTPGNTNTLKVHKRWMWPFSKSETMELKQNIESFMSTVNIALSIDGISTMLDVLDEVKSMQSTVVKFHAQLDVQARIQLNEEREKILSTVGVFNPQKHHQTNVKQRHPGTLSWFLDGEDFASWLSTPLARLWVFGIPGAGKSTLAAAAVDEAIRRHDAQNAVAYFYCDYKVEQTQDPRVILGSLAEQIARQNENSFARLSDLIRAHSPQTQVPYHNYRCEDLVQVIKDMVVQFSSTMILVDGLDECGENARLVTSYLRDLVAEPSGIKMFLSSRDVPDVRNLVDTFSPVSIAAQNTDLRLYVAAEIENRMNMKTRGPRLTIGDTALKGEILDRLVNGAEGMFRWTSVQLDYICLLPSDDDIRQALRSLPPDLFECYARLLRLMNKKPKAVRELTAAVLSWIVGHGSMSSKALSEALSVKSTTTHLLSSSHVSEERILQFCSSFIRKNATTNMLETAHFTVREFLEGKNINEHPELQTYMLSVEAERARVTTSLRYLSCEDFAEPCLSRQACVLRKERFPFLNEAILCMERYECNLTCDENIMRLLQELCAVAKIGCLGSWVQQAAYSDFSEGFDEMDVMLEASALGCEWYVGGPPCLNDFRDLKALHIATMLRLPELCEWLLANGACCNARSPLGTPLYCALRGTASFVPLDWVDEYLGDPGSPFHRKLKDIISSLIRHGAEMSGGVSDVTKAFTDAKYSSIMLLGFLLSDGDDMSVFQQLAGAGALVENDLINYLQSLTRSIPHSHYSVWRVLQIITADNLNDQTMISFLKFMGCFLEESNPLKLKQTYGHDLGLGKYAFASEDLIRILGMEVWATVTGRDPVTETLVRR